jgi:acetylornithine deacetylase/succinyl-diaminopimelate desuccinylase-like protein
MNVPPVGWARMSLAPHTLRRGETLMSNWERYLSDRRETSLAELTELLRIPSMSSLPDHFADVEAAAEWCAGRLRAAGMEHVEVMPTGGHPVVYGDWLHAEGKPTILVYGHFDVQPADPLELWTSPPFEPEVRERRLYARGASDMKGNLLISVLAVESWLKSEGSLPVNVKFLLEGQEEIGSPQLPVFVAQNKDRLAVDLVLSGDGMQWSETEPCILVGLRGGCALQINVRGAATDLHSGMFGGAVPNAIHALARILDSMRGPDGKILVEGFYDDVAPLSEGDRAQIDAVPFNEEAYKRSLDLPDLFGEPGYTTMQRVWARPTLEINGIWGGFSGEGVKTVTPNEAHAKITCRLVPAQQPGDIVEHIARHVERVAPASVRVSVDRQPFAAQPYYIPPDYWANKVAASVLAEVYGREPYYVRVGGSIPVCQVFLSTLGAYTVGFGFGQGDEQFHAPNEFLRLDAFERGQRAWALLLGQLGKQAITRS